MTVINFQIFVNYDVVVDDDDHDDTNNNNNNNDAEEQDSNNDNNNNNIHDNYCPIITLLTLIIYVDIVFC